MVIFFEEGVVFHGSLLQLQIDAAAVDTDDTPDSAWREREREKENALMTRITRNKIGAFKKKNS